MASGTRLIDADALAQKLKKHHDFYVEAWGGFKNLPPDTKARVDEISACWAEIYNEPTVDAVEVVRCKDCKHRSFDIKKFDTIPYCQIREHGGYCADNDFCSYGERKNND